MCAPVQSKYIHALTYNRLNTFDPLPLFPPCVNPTTKSHPSLLSTLSFTIFRFYSRPKIQKVTALLSVSSSTPHLLYAPLLTSTSIPLRTKSGPCSLINVTALKIRFLGRRATHCISSSSFYPDLRCIRPTRPIFQSNCSIGRPQQRSFTLLARTTKIFVFVLSLYFVSFLCLISFFFQPETDELSSAQEQSRFSANPSRLASWPSDRFVPPFQAVYLGLVGGFIAAAGPDLPGRKTERSPARVRARAPDFHPRL